GAAARGAAAAGFDAAGFAGDGAEAGFTAAGFAAAGFAGGAAAAEPPGIFSGCWQAGHLTVLPANSSFAANALPQAHCTLIGMEQKAVEKGDWLQARPHGSFQLRAVARCLSPFSTRQ